MSFALQALTAPDDLMVFSMRVHILYMQVLQSAGALRALAAAMDLAAKLGAISAETRARTPLTPRLQASCRLAAQVAADALQCPAACGLQSQSCGVPKLRWSVKAAFLPGACCSSGACSHVSKAPEAYQAPFIVSTDKQAAAAAFGAADVALGVASGRPVATAIPGSGSRAPQRRQQSTARRAARDTAAAASPPPPPPPLSDAVLIQLLLCCLGMQQIAQPELPRASAGGRSSSLGGGGPIGVGSGGRAAAAAAEAAAAEQAAGVRLVGTATSAMAVLAVAAVPALAAASVHAADLKAAQVETSRGHEKDEPFDMVLALLVAVVTLWEDPPPQDLLPSLIEVGSAGEGTFQVMP